MIVTIEAQQSLPPVMQIRAKFFNEGTLDTNYFPAARGTEPIEFDATFSVTFPRSRNGEMSIALDAFGATTDNPIASGKGMIAIIPGGTTRVTLALAAGAAPCGNGTVDASEECDYGRPSSDVICDVLCRIWTALADGGAQDAMNVPVSDGSGSDVTDGWAGTGGAGGSGGRAIGGSGGGGIAGGGSGPGVITGSGGRSGTGGATFGTGGSTFGTGGSTFGTGGAGTGGAGTGGRGTGGAATGGAGTGGAGTGGAATGGAGTGGRGTGGSSGTNPCAGLCSNPIVITTQSYSSGNLGTGATCHETTIGIQGGSCSNFVGPRTFSINGTNVPAGVNWPALPAKRNNGYCLQASAGDASYAAFITF